MPKLTRNPNRAKLHTAARMKQRDGGFIGNKPPRKRKSMSDADLAKALRWYEYQNGASMLVPSDV